MLYTPDNPISVEIVRNIQEQHKLMNRAVKVLSVFQSKTTRLQTRYRRAARDDKRPFRYNLRIKLATLESMMCIYHKYAEEKATLLEKLQTDLEEAEDNFYNDTSNN